MQHSWTQLFIIFILWAIVMLGMGLLQIHSDTEAAQDLEKMQPLRDVVHDWDLHVTRKVADYLLIATFLLALVLVFGKRQKTSRWIILRRLLVITGFLYFLRAVCLTVTTLPPPRLDCPYRTADSATEYFERAIRLLIGDMTCTDLIFSGHALIFWISAFLVDTYFIAKRIWRTIFVPLFYCLAVIGCFFIIVGELHYTVDVILAAILTWLTWALFHFAVVYRTLYRYWKNADILRDIKVEIEWLRSAWFRLMNGLMRVLDE